MQEDRKTAAYLFTDREEPVEAFWKNYNMIRSGSPNDRAVPRVLNYYGIGGIGKTTLLKKLITEMREKVANPRFVHWDFKFSRERSDVLQSLKTKLEDKYDFAFPLFSLAMYTFMRKTGKPSCAPEIKTLIDSSPFLKSVVGIVGEIPLFGLSAKILTAVDQIAAYGRNWYDSNRRDLIRIEGDEDDTPDIVYESLAYSFAKDMANNVKAANEPFVFFLDGYESLVDENASMPLGEDEWLRGGKGRKGENSLIRNIPNALWIIAGNEKLRWIEKDFYWERKLEQHLLGSLSKEDTLKFLSGVVVLEDPRISVRSELYHDLYALTNGVPLYLDLCIDKYAEIAEEGREPGIDDFGKDTDSLMERFVGDMDDGKRDILFMLSCMHCWDEELIAETAEKILGNFSRNAFNTIRRLSFITVGSERDTMHPAVGDVLYRRCSENTPSIREKAERTLADYYEEKLTGREESSPGFVGDLLLYARYATARGMEDPAALYRNAFAKHAKSLTESYKLDAALDLLELFWSRAATLPDSVDKASLASDFAEALCENGRYKDAAALNEFAYTQRKKVLGDNDRDTLESAGYLASTYSLLGRLDEALALHEEVLAKRRKVLGEDHRDTLTSMNNVAVVSYYIGRLEDARILHEKTLTQRRKVLGENDRDTLNSMNNLTSAYAALGRHNEALALGAETLAKRHEVLGEEHPSTLTSMNNLAFAYTKLGRYDEALALEEMTLAKRREIQGEEHPFTLASMANLAGTYYNLGRFEEALELFLETLAKMRDILGENHPSTLVAINGLASTYEALGRGDDAIALFEENFTRRREVLGEDHPNTLMTMANLAVAYDKLGHHEKALALNKETLAKRREILGEGHPDTLMTMNNLATTYSNLNRLEDALALYKETLEKRCKILGENHPETLLTMTCLATTYDNLGRVDDALALKEKTLAKKREVFGENTPDMLVTMNNLALTYHKLDRYDKALALFEEVFSKRRQVLGADHPDTLVSMNNLAFTYHELGRHDEALALHQETLAKRRILLGEEHIDTLMSMNNLAFTYHNIGRLDEARALHEETLVKRRMILGQDHPHTLVSVKNLVSTYSALGRHEEAAKLKATFGKQNEAPSKEEESKGLLQGLKRLFRGK